MDDSRIEESLIAPVSEYDDGETWFFEMSKEGENEVEWERVNICWLLKKLESFRRRTAPFSSSSSTFSEFSATREIGELSP